MLPLSKLHLDDDASQAAIRLQSYWENNVFDVIKMVDNKRHCEYDSDDSVFALIWVQSMYTESCGSVAEWQTQRT